jgi:hypothetical protein
MKAVNVTTTAAEIVPAGARNFVHLYNNSDTVIYLSYDGSTVEVTTANGMPIVPGAYLLLDNSGPRNIHVRAVRAIHGGAGNKELRIQGID